MIPQRFHTIWVQGELPPQQQQWFDSWLAHNPEWEHTLWSEPDYLPLVEGSPLEVIYRDAVNHAQRAEIARLLILKEHGGICVDADFECLRPFDFLDGIECFAPYERNNELTMSIVGCVPNHPALEPLIENQEAQIRWQREKDMPFTFGGGPYLFQKHWRMRRDVTRLPGWMFFPYFWDEPKPASYGKAYAVHHWSKSWGEDAVG